MDQFRPNLPVTTVATSLITAGTKAAFFASRAGANELMAELRRIYIMYIESDLS